MRNAIRHNEHGFSARADIPVINTKIKAVKADHHPTASVLHQIWQISYPAAGR
jgi:hypothetical protein